MFRYRWFYRDVLEPRGLVVPLVISEAGIDGIIGNRPGPDGLGWQDFQSFWVAQGWGPDGQTPTSTSSSGSITRRARTLRDRLYTVHRGRGSAWPSYRAGPFPAPFGGVYRESIALMGQGFHPD